MTLSLVVLAAAPHFFVWPWRYDYLATTNFLFLWCRLFVVVTLFDHFFNFSYLLIFDNAWKRFFVSTFYPPYL